MSINVYEFTDQNFESDVQKSDLPVLVDFWAVWWGPCKAIGPILEEVADEYKKKAEEIIRNSKYWQMRIYSFPQILKLAGFTNQDDLTKYLDLKIPPKLVPDKYQIIFDKINARREAKLWKD